MTEAYTTALVIYNFLVWCFAIFFAWLDIDFNMLSAFGFLLVVDYLTGIGKAYKLGHSITSNKMKYGIISKLSLVLIPLALAAAAKGLGTNSMVIVETSMTILIVSELYSIIGNYYSMKTGLEMPEYDAITILGKRLRGVLIRLEGDKDDTV